MVAKNDNSLIVRLKEEMKKRKVSVLKLSKETDIPSPRIYKWYQEGTKPKLEDAQILEKWLASKVDVEKSINFEVDYQNKYIALLEQTIADKNGEIKEIREKLDIFMKRSETWVKVSQASQALLRTLSDAIVDLEARASRKPEDLVKDKMREKYTHHLDAVLEEYKGH